MESTVTAEEFHEIARKIREMLKDKRPDVIQMILLEAFYPNYLILVLPKEPP